MSWVVVKFIESDEIEALPEKWVRGDTAFYPPYVGKSKIERAIKMQESPDTLQWNLYRVKLMSETRYATFSMASAKASKACQVSDISGPEDTLPTKRIPKKKYVDTSDEVQSDTSIEDFPPMALPVPTQGSTNLIHPRKVGAEPLAELRNRSHLLDGANSSATVQQDTDDFHQKVLGFLVKITKILRDHEVQLTRIEALLEENKLKLDLFNAPLTEKNNIAGNMPECPDIFSNLPVNTQPEFDQAEHDIIENDHSYKLFVKKLTNLGGHDFKDCVKRMMKKIMTDEIMKMYSLSGHKGKLAFSKTRLYQELLEAVQQCDSRVTVKEIETKISIFLSKAPERLQNKLKKGEEL